MNQAIEIKGLCKSFPGFALQNVSFSLPEGSIMGFIGENGAGKSTLFLNLNGVLTPQSGEVLLDGAPVSYIKWDMNRSISDAFSCAAGPEGQGPVYLGGLPALPAADRPVSPDFV